MLDNLKRIAKRGKLVRSKPLKSIIHTGKRYEKASENVNPRRSFVALLWLRSTLWCCRKITSVGGTKFSHTRLPPALLLSLALQWFPDTVAFSVWSARSETERVAIYGNFPSAETAFPRHYALWQCFVTTTPPREMGWELLRFLRSKDDIRNSRMTRFCKQITDDWLSAEVVLWLIASSTSRRECERAEKRQSSPPQPQHRR